MPRPFAGAAGVRREGAAEESGQHQPARDEQAVTEGDADGEKAGRGEQSRPCGAATVCVAPVHGASAGDGRRRPVRGAVVPEPFGGVGELAFLLGGHAASLLLRVRSLRGRGVKEERRCGRREQ